LGLAGAALAFPGTRNSSYNPVLAAHTSIWISEAAARNRRPAEILDEAFGGIHRAGFGRAELTEEFCAPNLLDRTLPRLARYNLDPSIVCASGAVHAQQTAEPCRGDVAALARSFNGRATYIGFTAAAKPGGQPKTAQELATQAYQLNLMGQELQRAGAGLLLNHGIAEMRDDAREWRYMLAQTEPRFVSVALDVESAARAGANFWGLMEAAGNRLRALNLRNTRRGASQEVFGQGDVDMQQIADALRSVQYNGFLVLDLRYDATMERRRSLPQALSLSRWYAHEVFGSRPGGPPVDMGPHVRATP
jgi:sugar phosphate isomerase/epimerase